MKLFVKTRERGTAGSLRLLRREGNIPAVVYGPDTKPRSLSVKAKDFHQVFSQAGESSLIDFFIDQDPCVKVLIKDVQYDPVSDEVIHVDFFQVDMNKPIEAEVSIVFEGEAPAVKELGGILNRQLEEVEIKCLPSDLIHSITVDLSVLATFDDVIYVRDLPVPENVEILNNPDDVVAMVSEPISEEELKAMEEAPEEEEDEEEQEESEKKKDESDKDDQKDSKDASSGTEDNEVKK